MTITRKNSPPTETLYKGSRNHPSRQQSASVSLQDFDFQIQGHVILLHIVPADILDVPVHRTERGTCSQPNQELLPPKKIIRKSPNQHHQTLIWQQCSSKGSKACAWPFSTGLGTQKIGGKAIYGLHAAQDHG